MPPSACARRCEAKGSRGLRARALYRPPSPLSHCDAVRHAVSDPIVYSAALCVHFCLRKTGEVFSGDVDAYVTRCVLPCPWAFLPTNKRSPITKNACAARVSSVCFSKKREREQKSFYQCCKKQLSTRNGVVTTTQAV